MECSKRKYPHSIIFVLFFVLILISCQPNNNVRKEEIFLLKKKTVYLDNIMTLDRRIEVKINNKDGFKVFLIRKIIEIGEDSLLAMDPLTSSIFLIDSNGNIVNKYSRKGGGPGEFSYLKDIIIDNERNLYALDLMKSVVAKFNPDFTFNKFYLLSYEHRIPRQLGLFGGRFIVSAERNLTPHSVKGNYGFLDFKDVTYLNIYNQEFKIQGSVLNPADELLDTKGIFNLPYDNFSPFCVVGNYLMAMTQEGFYSINLYYKDFTLRKVYKVIDENFKKIELSQIKELSIINHKPNLSMEKIGHIVAGHSIPVDLTAVGNFVFITIAKPSDNYYPQYSKEIQRKLYMDIFYFDNEKLKPVIGGIATQKRIIGVSNNNVIYTSSFYSEKNQNSIIIEKMRLKNEFIKKTWE